MFRAYRTAGATALLTLLLAADALAGRVVGSATAQPAQVLGFSDCNENGIDDAAEVAAGTSPDCNSNGLPDECDTGKNDCDGNGVPDECQPDCNNNGNADACDIIYGFTPDCNLNRVPDDCDISAGTASGDEGGVLDACSFWISTTGLWSNASAWDPPEAPDNTPSRKYHVTIEGFSADVTLDIDAEIQTLHLVQSTFRGEAGPWLRLTQGDLTIESTDGAELEGEVIIGPGHGLYAGTTFGIRGYAPVRLAGGDAFIASRTPGDTMTSRSGIHGFGRISADYINESYLSADEAETTLVVAGPGSKVNNGLFEAKFGGRLLLDEVGGDLRALDVTGTGYYEAENGTIQLGAGGGNVGVSGSFVGLYFDGIFAMASPWSLVLSDELFIAGGVFDPDTATTGFLQVPRVNIYTGAMNLGAETVADIGEVVVVYDVGGRSEGAARGLTPPVLNVKGGAKSSATEVTVGDGGAVEATENAQLEVAGAVLLGQDTVRAGTRGLTPPVLNVKGQSKVSAGQFGVQAGALSVENAGELTSAGPVVVGGTVVRGGERGLTPPVLNVKGQGKATAGSIEVVGAAELSVTDSGSAESGGDIVIQGAPTRGLTPPVLNVTGGGKASSKGNFQLQTSADVSVTGAVTVGGNFENQSTDPGSFDWADGTLTMAGATARAVQLLENASEDRGPFDTDGFNSNFALGTLEIATNAIVQIVDEFDNQEDGTAACDEASYVKVLIIQPGATLLSNGCRLYYETLINEGGTIPDLGTRIIPIGGGDLDTNGVVDVLDFEAFLAAFGACEDDAAYAAAADLDADGCVTLADYQVWYALFTQYGQPRREAHRGPALVNVRLEPAASAVTVGETFTVNIVADLPLPVLGWGLDLTVADSGIVQFAGAPAIGPAWLAAPASDGDGLAALAFPSSVSGSGIVLASVQLMALAPGQTDLLLSTSAGDLAEGFALEPTGFAEVVYAPGSITVAPAATATPGWNWVDVGITLTGNQPTYWSAATGRGGTSVPPFTILNPASPPGVPAADGSGERVLRGFILAWAVDASGAEIRWNHLTGGATLINYATGSAWEYASNAFQVVNGAPHGAPSGSAGILALNGGEYDNAFGLLLLDFYATGSQPLGLNSSFALDSELTLMPLTIDVRQEGAGPVTTKASFTIWNQNETKLTGLDRCITCWDSTLLGRYGAPNHFLVANLQTDKGKAQIEGLASQLCDVDFDPGDGLPLGADPRDRVSQASALAGVAVKQIRFSADGDQESAGASLTGMGTESAAILADLTSGEPPQRAGAATRAPGATRDGATVALAATDRTSISTKGSLLVYPKVELRWDSSGTELRQDTFIDLVNDYPADVMVQMYFVNGDPPAGQ